jgi:hypothetical protein
MLINDEKFKKTRKNHEVDGQIEGDTTRWCCDEVASLGAGRAS